MYFNQVIRNALVDSYKSKFSSKMKTSFFGVLIATVLFVDQEVHGLKIRLEADKMPAMDEDSSDYLMLAETCSDVCSATNVDLDDIMETAQTSADLVIHATSQEEEKKEEAKKEEPKKEEPKKKEDKSCCKDAKDKDCDCTKDAISKQLKKAMQC